MSRRAAKHELEPSEVAALSVEIDRLQYLQNRFAQPFLTAHSQDAEADDEDAEEGPESHTVGLKDASANEWGCLSRIQGSIFLRDEGAFLRHA